MNKFSKKDRAQCNKIANAMTPLNWMCSICGGIMVASSSLNHDNWFGIFSACLVGVIIVGYFLAYFYFMIKDPNRLQSEQYNLKAMEYGLLLSPNDKAEVMIVDGSESPTLANSKAD